MRKVRDEPAIPRIDERALTDEELRRLLDAESDDSASAVRNKLLLLLMATCGLRVSEALRLLPRDVVRQGGEVSLRLGWTTGAAPDLRPVAEEAAELLGRWLELRANLGIEDRSPILCTLSEGQIGSFGWGGPKPGEALSREYVYELCQRLAEQAGISDKPVTPRSLRQCYRATAASPTPAAPPEPEPVAEATAEPPPDEPPHADEGAPPVVAETAAVAVEEPAAEEDDRTLEIATALRALPREQREAIARALLEN